MPRPLGRTYDEWIHVRVPANIHNRLRSACDQKQVSVSEHLRTLIEKSIRDVEVRKCR